MKRLVLILAAFIALAFVPTEAQIYVIANKSVSAGSINKTKLIDIFTLNMTNWDSGDKIVVLDLKGESDTKTKFYNTLGMNYTDLRKIWLKKQFSGKGMPPKALLSEKDIVRQVASTPGAISYISASELSSDVKILAKIE